MTQAGSIQLPPPAPIAPAAIQVTVGPNGVGTTLFTKADVAALRARASVLSDQLQQASGRRSRLQQSLRQATGVDKAGLEQRLGVLDARIARLETDIDENGKQLASLPVTLVTSSQEPAGFNPSRLDRVMDKFTPIAIVFTLFVLAPVAFSMARMLWKRGSLSRQAPASPENAQRLERMEQAIDSIAIEMERVSEGQRFVTRLLAEQRPGVVVGTGLPAPDVVAAQAGQRPAAPR